MSRPAQATERGDVFSWVAGAWARIPSSSKFIFSIAVIANLVSYGFIFSNLTLNHDGFGFITVGGSAYASTGRWAADVIYHKVFGSFEIIWLYGLIGVVLFIFTAFSICRVLRAKEFSARLIIVLLYTLFPYVCNYYAYAFYIPIYGIAALLSVTAVELGLKPGIGPKVLGALCVTGSLASYQAFVASTLTLICLAIALEAAEADEPSRFGRTFFRRTAGLLAVPAAGALGYALSLRICTGFLGVHLNDYQGASSMALFNAATLNRGVRLVIGGTLQFLGLWSPPYSYDNYYFRGLYKFLSTAVFAFALYGLWLGSKRKLAGFAGAAFLALAVVAPRALQIIHPDANYHELTLGGYSIFLCGTFAIALAHRNRILRSAVQVAGIVLLAGFIQSNNVAAMSLALDYQASMHWANRVLARVEALPNYGSMAYPAEKRIIFVGDLYQVSQWHYLGRPFITSVGIADGIPDIVFPSLFQLLRINVVPHGLKPDDQDRALEYAATHRPWPAPDSVTVLDDGTIVVVLENAKLVSHAGSR